MYSEKDPWLSFEKKYGYIYNIYIYLKWYK